MRLTDLLNADAKRKPTTDSFPVISNCRGLCELEISLPSLPQDEVSLFSSITSTNLQRIVLPTRYGFERMGDPVFAPYYRSIDDCLCQLVGRLRRSGYKRRLEVVFRIKDVPDDEQVFEEFLPRFREQGRVKIMQELGGRIVYSSDQ